MVRGWKVTFQCIKDTHDDAFRAVDRAIKLEELEKPELAIQEYKKAVTLIDRSLSIPVERPEGEDESWEQACAMIEKLKSAREEVLIRVSAVSRNLATPQKSSSAAAATSPVEVNAVETRPRTYQELAEALREMKFNEWNEASSLELLFSCDNVKVYHIKTSGEVTSTFEESTLRIVRLEKDSERKLDSTIFLQVIQTQHTTRIEHAEEPLLEMEVLAAPSAATPPPRDAVDPSIIYPLFAGVSPCFRTDYGAFILPDLESSNGSAVGLILPPGADEIVLEILVQLLHGVMKEGGVIEFGDIAKRDKRRASAEIVSQSIVKGACYVSKGLIYSAEKAGEFITYSTPYLLSRLTKNETGESVVSENVRTGITAAKNATAVAVNVTEYVGGKVGQATMALGRFLAPHIQRHGSRLLSAGFGMEHSVADERMHDVLTVCAGAVEGFGTVYNGLEQSASILGRNLSTNTVKVVEHRYGAEAGDATGIMLDTVGNVINVSRNASFITPKGFAKKTATGAGRGLVETFRSPTEEPTPLYPNLDGLAKKLNESKVKEL